MLGFPWVCWDWLCELLWALRFDEKMVDLGVRIGALLGLRFLGLYSVVNLGSGRSEDRGVPSFQHPSTTVAVSTRRADLPRSGYISVLPGLGSVFGQLFGCAESLERLGQAFGCLSAFSP